MFTAGEVFRATFIRAPELRTKPPRGDIVAAAFNEALLELVLDVIDIDEERLAGRYTVPAWVVARDPIDLTLSGDEADPKPREWLRIAYVDWRDAAGEGDEVWITTIEARNRAAHDYDGAPAAVIEDQLRVLRPAGSWPKVDALEVYGVLAPESVSAQTFDSTRFDYPRIMQAALRWELLCALASPSRGFGPDRIAYFEAKRREAADRLAADARNHASSRIEDQPLALDW